MAFKELNSDGSEKAQKKVKIRTKDDIELLKIILEENPNLREKVLRKIEVSLGRGPGSKQRKS